MHDGDVFGRGTVGVVVVHCSGGAGRLDGASSVVVDADDDTLFPNL